MSSRNQSRKIGTAIIRSGVIRSKPFPAAADTAVQEPEDGSGNPPENGEEVPPFLGALCKRDIL